MRIHIPNSAFLGNIDQFLRSFDNTQQDELQVTAHKEWVSVHPVVISMVAALGLSVPKENIVCEPIEAKSKHYLQRMGLFDSLGITSSTDMIEHEPAGRFIPVTRIQNSEQLTHFITDIVPLLHLDPMQAEPLRFVISELTRNVIEHSQSSFGAVVCAQYYPKANMVRIGIVDRGVGIKESISQSYAAENDYHALRLALMPGITGTTRKLGGTEFNAGAGLFFIKSIAKVSRDFFMIYSGDTMYKLLKSNNKKIKLTADPFKDNHSINSDFPYWQGTAVGVDISLDSNDEFSELLDLIKSTISEAIQERKREMIKKARFI